MITIKGFEFLIPLSTVSFLLHIKKHGKKDTLHTNTECYQGKCCRNEERFEQYVFEIEAVDAQYQGQQAEERAKKIKEHERVETKNNIFHLHPPEKIPHKKAGEPDDVGTIVNPGFFPPILGRMGHIFNTEPNDIQSHEEIIAVPIHRIDIIETDSF